MNFTPDATGRVFDTVEEWHLQELIDENDVLGAELVNVGDMYVSMNYSEHFVILDQHDYRIKCGTAGFSGDEVIMRVVYNLQFDFEVANDGHDYFNWDDDGDGDGDILDYDDDDADYMVYVGPTS